MGLLFLLAVVGIYVGWFSPTEGAAVSALAAIVIGLASRTLDWRGLFAAFGETVQATAVLFFVVVGAFVFSRFIALSACPAPGEPRGPNEPGPGRGTARDRARLPRARDVSRRSEHAARHGPGASPGCYRARLRPVWFGVFVTVMATVGLVSPPLGLTVFVIQAHHPTIGAGRIYRATLPFVAADLVLVVLLVALPLSLSGFPRNSGYDGPASAPARRARHERAGRNPRV